MFGDEFRQGQKSERDEHVEEPVDGRGDRHAAGPRPTGEDFAVDGPRHGPHPCKSSTIVHNYYQ